MPLLIDKILLEEIDPLVAFLVLDIRAYIISALETPSPRFKVRLFRRHTRISWEIVHILKDLLALL